MISLIIVILIAGQNDILDKNILKLISPLSFFVFNVATRNI